MTDPVEDSVPHVVLIGGGIMSATLGLLLERVEPRFISFVWGCRS